MNIIVAADAIIIRSYFVALELPRRIIMIIKITVEAIADPISAGIHTSPPSRIIPAIIVGNTKLIRNKANKP